MALTALQRQICRLLAEHRIASGESYVAGGVALNELLAGSRVSRDIDVFHDTNEAVIASWESDRRVLASRGFAITVLRERPSHVEAEVRTPDEIVRVEWARDSAYRFFPLVRHPDLGLALHPFDLATNKVLALIGRVEIRDWVDTIHCGEHVQPLGYLAWAAAWKDPGFSPGAILDEAARTCRYAEDEVAELAFDGPPPSAGDLSRRWRSLLDAARATVEVLPAGEMGTCVLTTAGTLFQGSAREAAAAVNDRRLLFHRGRIRGALPQIRR